MLLHGQDTGGVPVRAGPEHGAAGAGARLVRVDRARLFRPGVGRAGRERGPDDRAADDVHPVRGGVRRPDGGHVPGRRDRHAQLDDDHRRAAHTARVPQAPAPRVAAELLVHHVAHTHQHHHTRLLRAGAARLGLEQGQVDHRRGELSHIAGHDRVQLHVADIPAHARGQPHRPVKVRLDARVEPHLGRHIQVAVRLRVLPDVPERHATGDHQQPALARVQGPGQRVPGGQGAVVLPVAVLRRVRHTREVPIHRAARHRVPQHLAPGRRAQGLGPGVPRRHHPVHRVHGHIHTALRHTDGLYRQLHRHHAVVHMAVLLPPEAQGRLARVAHHHVQLLRHIPRLPVRRHRRLRLRHRHHQSVPDRVAVLIAVPSPSMSLSLSRPITHAVLPRVSSSSDHTTPMSVTCRPHTHLPPALDTLHR